MFDSTIKFKLDAESNVDMKNALSEVYNALVEKGYDPINQLVGYILSED